MAKQSSTPAKPTKKGLSGGVIALTIFLMVVAFSCGFGALTVQADLNQPVAASAPMHDFVVANGEHLSTIIDQLESQKIIRSALVFKLYLRIKGVTPSPQPGTYSLSPSMHLSDIVTALSKPRPDVTYAFTVREGLRLTEYPAEIMNSLRLQGTDQPVNDASGKNTLTLKNFSAADFLKYTVQGAPTPDINMSNYWYVKSWGDPAQGKVYASLEGYLLPATYFVTPDATTTDVIKKMLDGLGYLLCDSHYIYVQADCRAHQNPITPTAVPAPYKADIGAPIGVFDALDKYYKGSLADALTIGSFAQREARSVVHFQLVSSSYYNRWQNLGNAANETVGYLGADPAEQYYLGSQPGATETWPALNESVKNMANNPYNLYLTKGLSPSAIAGAGSVALYAAIDPVKTTYLYFYFSAKDCTNLYFNTDAASRASQNANPAGGVGTCNK